MWPEQRQQGEKGGRQGDHGDRWQVHRAPEKDWAAETGLTQVLTATYEGQRVEQGGRQGC